MEPLIPLAFLALIAAGLALIAIGVRDALRRRQREPSPRPMVARAMPQTFDIPAPVTDAPAAPPTAAPYSTRYPLLATPHICLSGPVDHAMYQSFRDQLANAPTEGTLVIAISTLGGDPEVARLMGDEVRLLREYTGREILFLGKVAVYSAGATFMAHFPVDKRFLTQGTRLMIHERKLTADIHLEGPLKTLVPILQAKLHEIEESIRIEEEGFRDIVAGSNLAFEELCKKAPSNLYLEAEEARELGLVLDLI